MRAPWDRRHGKADDRRKAPSLGWALFRSTIADRLAVGPAHVTMDARLVVDLGADSLDLVELVMVFEEEFGRMMPNEELDHVVTVQDAWRLACRVLEQDTAL